jgi:hypothetical protein
MNNPNYIMIEKESWKEAMDEIQLLRQKLDAMNKRVDEMNIEKSDLIYEITARNNIIKGLKIALKTLSGK